MKVFQAINAVQQELLKGIGKTQKNAQQHYNFRGIDDVYNALAPALAKHGLVILPEVIERSVIERSTRNGGALFYVTLKVNYHFASAEDGSQFTVAAYGEAMDSGDKATNKAMSAAYKYACFQTFCIPTESVDADSETHEVTAADISEQIESCASRDEAAALWKTIPKKEQPKYLDTFKAKVASFEEAA